MFSCGNKAYISGHWILLSEIKTSGFLRVWQRRSHFLLLLEPTSSSGKPPGDWESVQRQLPPFASPSPLRCDVHESLLVGTRPLTLTGEWTGGLT